MFTLPIRVFTMPRFRVFTLLRSRCSPWRSRAKGGRPGIDPEVRTLIKRMATANMWGAPRIHGELLKLGIDVSEATVSKYMPRRRKPPSQTWRTFLDNHVQNLVSVDFFTVPTVLFHVLFVFVVLAHDRRRIRSLNVTSSPSAAWTAILADAIVANPEFRDIFAGQLRKLST